MPLARAKERAVKLIKRFRAPPTPFGWDTDSRRCQTYADELDTDILKLIRYVSIPFQLMV